MKYFSPFILSSPSYSFEFDNNLRGYIYIFNYRGSISFSQLRDIVEKLLVTRRRLPKLSCTVFLITLNWSEGLHTMAWTDETYCCCATRQGEKRRFFGKNSPMRFFYVITSVRHPKIRFKKSPTRKVVAIGLNKFFQITWKKQIFRPGQTFCRFFRSF